MKRGTPDHPKARALATALGLARFEVVGLLESLWHFTATYARHGDIGRFSDMEIAEYLGWEPGSHEALIRYLVKTRWLDECPCHRLRVHDWHDHADQTVSRSIKGQFLECYSLKLAETSSRLVSDSVSASAAGLPLPLPLPEPKPEPIPEPEPLPCDGRSVSPSDLAGFTQEIVAEFCRIRGYELPEISPREHALIQKWGADGVPLRVVLRGMADCLQLMQKRRDKPDSKPLGYYDSAVREAYRLWKKAMQVPA